MSGAGRAVVLDLVDRVLGDLAPPDGMFVGRRDRDSDWRSVVIQTGEEGRYRLSVPDVASPRSVEAFIAEAQAHLQVVFDRPLPPCPLHGHALVGQVEGADIAWACPQGAWRCQLGDYEEQTWPPELDAGNMAAALAARLARRGIHGWHTIGFERRVGGWTARIGLWPMDPELMERIAEAALPVAVAFEAYPALPRRV